MGGGRVFPTAVEPMEARVVDAVAKELGRE
jgi:hypothetical protein